MAKVTKPQSKAPKTANDKQKATDKVSKIAKAKAAPKPRVRSADPKPARGGQQRARGQPKFYTVGEDAQILDALRNVSETNNKSAVAKDLATRLQRTVESVRDRIKRYLANLSAADAKELQRVAKKSPGHFVHFSNDSETRRVDKIIEDEPSIYNREHAGTGERKAKKPATVKKVDFTWVLKKINAADPYFAIDHSVHLLNSIFAQLLEQGLERRELEHFINSQEGEVTLFEILSNFAKKDSAKTKAK